MSQEKPTETAIRPVEILAPSSTAHGTGISPADLKNADEALAFLQYHPQASEIAEQGNAILDDPVARKRLIRKIDASIAPLLAAVYFLQYLDKTTLQYTAVMGLREDTHLKGQEYSILALVFYVGMKV
jgi:hypothetical protein